MDAGQAWLAPLPAVGSSEATAVAQRLALQVARIAALGAVEPVRPIPGDGAAIRAELLVEQAPWVSFEGLLDYCWGHGIVVIHVSNFPRGLKRMHGLAARVDGRPVIVLSWARRHPAWLLFVLAHELGHLALGHVDEGTTLIDDEVDKESGDAEERAANDFALALLCGSSETRFSANDRWLKAEALAAAATKLGHELRIDPGHIVLNYANTMGKSFYAVANAALALLPGAADAPEAARRRLAGGLDWERLPAESSEFVMRMTRGTKVETVAAD